MHRQDKHSLSATRRGFLAASAVTPLLASAPVSADGPDIAQDRIARDLQRYVGFGNKQSGGPGDEACGAWFQDLIIQLDDIIFSLENVARDHLL